MFSFYSSSIFQVSTRRAQHQYKLPCHATKCSKFALNLEIALAMEIMIGNVKFCNAVESQLSEFQLSERINYPNTKYPISTC